MHTQHPKENSPQDPRRVSDCFKAGTLKTIVDKAHFLLALDRQLQQILTEEYRGHCQVTNLEGTALCIGVSNAGLATRLRYQNRDLLSQLKALAPELLGVTVLNVKVKL